MKKEDARKQTREVLHARRKQVVRLHLEGVPVMQIVERSGLSWYAVNAAIKRYKAEGESALKPEKRGRKQGTGRILTQEQEAAICQFIRKRRPWYYGLKDSLWNRVAVMGLIEQKCGIKLTVRGTGNYLRRWGLTLKNPKKHVDKPCSTTIPKYFDVHYPKIEQQPEQDTVMVYANLECQVNGLIAKMPEAIAAGGRRQKLTMVSVVNEQGKVRWAIFKGAFNSDRREQFMNALYKDTGN